MAVKEWVQSQGGVLAGASQRRAQQVADRLMVDRPELRVEVSVLDTATVSAFSWPNRRVFVTRGLVERMDDQELAAAIAHELGHLIDGHHVHGGAGLRGCEKGLVEAEARADELGAQLLEAHALPRTALSRLLTKVSAAGPPDPTCRAAITRRVKLLDERTGQQR